ncbi:MAG: cytochrome c5 family protein [Gammaproteobacteria bacterium]|nr:cytochrome c5 family protein [Gammaproteobacteria bacterium]
MRVILAAAAVCLAVGCSDQSQPAEVSVQPFADAAINADGMARWSRTCAMCHVNGEGGAPRVGDAAAWGDRLAKGEDLIMQHTIEGLNNMPPLGYCMDCERDDLRAFIRFMAQGGAS